MAGHPPRGRLPTTPTARSPHRTCKPRGQCWAPTPAHPRPQHVGSGPRQPARRAGSRGRGSARPQKPLTTEEHTPPGDGLPPTPQRATPAHKGARSGAGAGSLRPHQPHRGHTGRGTPAARPRGRAAGGGTAPDARRPSQRWQATPPGDGPPPPPRHTAPAGHASQEDSAGPPHPHTRAHGTWIAGPSSPKEEGSRRRESARPRTPLGTGSPMLHGRQGEHLMPTCTRERQPAEPAFKLPNPRPAAPIARTPATGNPRPTPCS